MSLNRAVFGNNFCSSGMYISYCAQWRRQLWGTGARATLNFQKFHF